MNKKAKVFLDLWKDSELKGIPLISLNRRATNIPIRKNLPARVDIPNGKFESATHIQLVPSGSGVKTAYSINKSYGNIKSRCFEKG